MNSITKLHLVGISTEYSVNFGIINSFTKLHLFGISTEYSVNFGIKNSITKLHFVGISTEYSVKTVNRTLFAVLIAPHCNPKGASSG